MGFVPVELKQSESLDSQIKNKEFDALWMSIHVM